jgi:hypothetical protein
LKPHKSTWTAFLTAFSSLTPLFLLFHVLLSAEKYSGHRWAVTKNYFGIYPEGIKNKERQLEIRVEENYRKALFAILENLL